MKRHYAAWDKIIEKHHPGLACDDIFLNTNLYSNRTLTKRECVDLIKKEIVMAHRLGFKVIRLVSMVPAWILEPCLETAEKYGVSLCIEIHGGLGFGVPKTEEFLEEMIVWTPRTSVSFLIQVFFAADHQELWMSTAWISMEPTRIW